ncbi:hypothetical protein MNBD_IGNAVI01-278, partial [hydrothermal vent metagenome]
MKKVLITFGVLVSMTLSAQTYTDKPYIQDYADKYELSETQKGAELLQVRSDRNKVINVLSTEGLLQPWDKKLVKEMLYRPLTDMNIIAFDRYEDQFVYLTDKAVLSNAWAGKFYIEHGLENPKQFVVAHNFTTLIATNNGLVLFQKGKKVWNETIDGLDPIKLIFDLKGKRFLILTNDALYQLQCPEKELSKVYEGNNLTAMAIKDDEIILGTNNGILTLDGKTFKAGELNKKLPWTEITAVENINGSLWFGSTKGAFKLRTDMSTEKAGSK